MSSVEQPLRLVRHGAQLADGATATAEFRAGVAELSKAYEYALRARRDVWDFAVEIVRLRSIGVTDSDFRWLTCMGYVEHAKEVTRLEEDGRRFRPTGDLSFTKRTCFVLTTLGHCFARCLLDGVTENADSQFDCNGHARFTCSRPDCLLFSKGNSARSLTRAVPQWDAERRELSMDGKVIKHFRSPAANQEMILGAFEEDGWPVRIDDPLPPQAEQDSKNRLHDTVKCLNRNHMNDLIRFRGDGTGEGVVWERVTPNSSHDRAS